MFASTQIDELLALIGAKQDAAPVLTSLSGLAGGPDTMVYLTGATSLATCTLSGAARLLIACADLSSIQSCIGLESAAFVSATTFDTAGSATAALAIAIQRSNHTGTQSWLTITGMPTTKSGYGITDVPSGSGTSSGTNTGDNVAASASVAGTMSASDKSKLDSYPAFLARSFNNAPARTLVSVAAAANGFQIDSARDAAVSYSISISSTSSISGGQAGSVLLEICSTNSATAANWIEIARTSNGQTNALIVALTVVVVGSGTVAGIVPAGYFARLRTLTTAGAAAPTYTTAGQQEVKLG